ncbi:MAG: GNAT family N-acetyltransferase [Ktedonobacterales bacterium]|nr:GNAT family N-acetyltransferase [Ktedonobacterales bacterium]
MSWLLATPHELGDGLRLRTATPADIEALVAFNGAVHTYTSDGAPSPRIMARVREWLDGTHPHIGPADFLLVEDAITGQIVSSVAVLRQQWAYAGMPFTVAQTEFVGTLHAYHRQGLVRYQMDVVHAASAAAGDLVQAINGIPWYYRQFGYALTLPMGGGRAMSASAVPTLPAGATEPFTIRPATPDDLPFIMAVEQDAQRRSLFAVQRTPAYWQHEVFTLGELNIFRRHWHVIQAPNGTLVGYLAHGQHPTSPRRWLTTLEVAEGTSWLAVVPSALRHLRELVGTVPAETLGIAGGREHPAYAVFPTRFALLDPPGAWYIRIPDEVAFLRQIAPILTGRLAASLAVGYTGEVRLNRYRSGILLRFAAGQLAEIAPWAAADARALTVASAAFPDDSFTHLLCGTRSLADLEAQYSDCEVATDEVRALLTILFPQRTSAVWVMG